MNASQISKIKDLQIAKDIIHTQAEILKRRFLLIKQMRIAIKLALLFIPENAVDAIKLCSKAVSASKGFE